MSQQNPFKTKEFRELQKKWYKKIANGTEGFQDIEGPSERLIDHNSQADLNQRIHFKKDLFEIRQAYYCWAASMLHIVKFIDRRDKYIWMMHSEGCTGQEIALRVGLERTWVNKKIKKIRAYITGK